MEKRRRLAAVLSIVIGTVILSTGCSILNKADEGSPAVGTSKLIVNSPEDGRISIDGKILGEVNAPISGIEPGKRTITVLGPNGEELFSQEAIIPEDSTLTLNTNPELFTGNVNAMDSESETEGALIPEEADPAIIPEEIDEPTEQISGHDSKALNTVTTLTIAGGTKYETPIYIIDSKVSGPTVWIVGGVHGNEPAGYKAADIVKTYRVKKGRLVVLPKANKLAISANSRYVSSTGDLNRAFPTSNSDSATGTLAKAIQTKLRAYKPDYLMDLHEGFDYYKNASTDSVGQSVIYYPSKDASTIANKIVNSLNPSIAGTYKDFSILKYPVKGSIARYAGSGFNVPAFIFETAAKVDINTRIGYQKTAVSVLLKHLQMN